MKKTFIFFVFFTFLLTARAASGESEPEILSEAAILIDAKSGSVLFEKNADKKMYPASLTKIATAIYALEHGDLDEIVTVSESVRGVEGSKVYLEVGEQIRLKTLIQGLLVNSGNDAGVAIAEHMHGSVEAFAENLNSYLKDLGLKNTYFVNPHGLFDPAHVTTAEDMAKLTQYAIQNETFSEIFGLKELKWQGKSWQTTIYTHHKLMREWPYEGVTGGKTGYTSRSKNTLVTTAERENISLIAVVLKGGNRNIVYDDTVKLLDYGFAHFKTAYIPKGSTFRANGDEFKAMEDFYYTKKIDEQVSKKVIGNGTLHIKNEQQELIAALPLENVSKNNQKENEDESIKMNAFHGISILFVLAIGMLFLRKAKKRSRTVRFE